MTYLTTVPAGSLLNGEAYYTTRFGFTSAACAGVAGICALIVSANPALTAREVKQVLHDSCEKIDASSGTYDAGGHSPLYGYGRPDVARAVQLATRHEKARAASV
jgi:subtilisin family serine protease